MQCLEGKDCVGGGRPASGTRALLDAALSRSCRSGGKGPVGRRTTRTRSSTWWITRRLARGGVHVAAALSSEFGFAGRARGKANRRRAGSNCPSRNADHFSFLAGRSRSHGRAGKATYPVERTLLATGLVGALGKQAQRRQAHRDAGVGGEVFGVGSVGSRGQDSCLGVLTPSSPDRVQTAVLSIGMFHPQGPTLGELAVQALSSTEKGYDLAHTKFDFTPFRTPDSVLDDRPSASTRWAPSNPGSMCAAAQGPQCAVFTPVPGASRRRGATYNRGPCAAAHIEPIEGAQQGEVLGRRVEDRVRGAKGSEVVETWAQAGCVFPDLEERAWTASSESWPLQCNVPYTQDTMLDSVGPRGQDP